MNLLDQLKKMTVVVSDSGEFAEIKKYHPVDATTNPSLIFAASQKPEYAHLVKDALKWAEKRAKDKHEHRSLALDKVFVNFGLEILKIIPGRVSTEVDARLSFDIEGSIKKAEHLVALYESAGIDRKRILIKLASTWEGIRAAEVLEKQGIHCNMTLLFSLPQAIACADAKVTLISPFVGRILDWYMKNEGKTYTPAQDPGVISVTEIYNYYKNRGIKSQIMGASFRNIGEIIELAGCDLLTIAPKLLQELENTQGTLTRKLDPEKAKAQEIHPIHLDEKAFRFQMCENAMANDKLAEGIRNFTKDIIKLEELLCP